MLQTTLASMCANYWSLLLLLCQQLLTFKSCSSLHCTSQAPFRFQFQMLSMSLRGCRTDMEFYLAPVSKSGALTFSSAMHSVLCKQFPAGTEMMQAGLFLTSTVVCLLVHNMGYYVQGLYAAVGYINWCNVSAHPYHIFH